MNTAKHLIVGTAGHIDHGKTTLIRALTGIDTDRLKEEKERGITIELGFAHLSLPSGTTVGIVDVPGHEKFIRHMVAGAAGMDLVMLIIAGDEGIMPQTREHLDICRMLGIKRGVVALTKKDLCEPEWLDLVTQEIALFTAGTFLEGAPVIPLSSTTGEGIPDLLAALDRLIAEIRPRPPWGIFRLPVDRVFTMKGFGTVVTGTTTSGTVRVGDPVRVYPGERESRVRGLQVHNVQVQEAEAGCRTAVNLQGIEKGHIRRGDIIGHPGQMQPSFIMDVRFTLLPSSPRNITDRARVRFHLGTSEILARIHLLEGEELKPGDQCLAQIRMEAPSVALARDRFVVRTYSPAVTIGGGVVIDPHAAKVQRKKKALDVLVRKLRSLEEGSPAEALLASLSDAGPAGGTAVSLSRSLNLDMTVVSGTMTEMEKTGAVLRFGEGPNDPVLHIQVFGDMKKSVVASLEKFHRENPLKAGISREELRTKLPKNLHPKVLATLMENLEREQFIVSDGKLARLSSYQVQLNPKQRELRDRLESALKKSDLSVPSLAELSAELRADQGMLLGLVEMMTGEGTLVKIEDDIYLHRDSFRKLSDMILDHFTSNRELTVGHFKEMTGLSRKYSIPMLEYFDRHGVTLRVGDKRVLKNR